MFKVSVFIAVFYFHVHFGDAYEGNNRMKQIHSFEHDLMNGRKDFMKQKDLVHIIIFSDSSFYCRNVYDDWNDKEYFLFIGSGKLDRSKGIPVAFSWQQIRPVNRN